MKKTKLILVLGALLTLAAACAKHGTPNYYNTKGEKETFKEYAASMKCNATIGDHATGFNVNTENDITSKRFGTSKTYSIRTLLVSDKQSASAAATTDAAQANVAAIAASEDYVSVYPVVRKVSELDGTAQKVVVNLNCDQGLADYSGPGTTSTISGVVTNKVHSVEIKGTDAGTGQAVDVTVERLIPDGTVKGMKAAQVIAQARDASGLHSFKITLVKTAATGSRTVVFQQDVIDDVTTTATIDTSLAQVYLQGLREGSDAQLGMKKFVTDVKASPTTDIPIDVLMAARDEIAASHRAGVAAQTPPPAPGEQTPPAQTPPAQTPPTDQTPAQQTPAKTPATEPTAGDAAPNPNDVAVDHPAEQKAAEQKAAEQKAPEQKAPEQKPAEQKAAEQKAPEQKPAEQKAPEQTTEQPPAQQLDRAPEVQAPAQPPTEMTKDTSAPQKNEQSAQAKEDAPVAPIAEKPEVKPDSPVTAEQPVAQPAPQAAQPQVEEHKDAPVAPAQAPAPAADNKKPEEKGVASNSDTPATPPPFDAQ